MNRLTNARPTPALIVALIALVAALSGAAVALPGKGTVKKNDIAKGAVTKKKIADAAVGSKQIIGKSIKGNRLKDGAVKAKQIADATITDKKIADGTITGAKIADETLSDAKISDYGVFGDGLVRVAATDGASLAAAQAAAPETELFAKGDLRVYAKCFRDTGTDELDGAIYIASSAAGAIFDSSDADTLPGGPAASDFLNPGTDEGDRELAVSSVIGPGADFDFGDNDGWRAFAPDGTSLTGTFSVAVKNGDLAGGNGVYGDGNVCLFGGSALG